MSIAATDDEEEEYVPQPAVKKASRVQVKPRAEKPNKSSKPVTTDVTVTLKKAKRLNNNNVRTTDLPEFAHGKWRDTFLPTLYDKFFSSNQPFDGFNKGSDQFITILQSIIKEVYPDVDYELTPADSIYLLVRQCSVILLAYYIHLTLNLIFL